MSLGLTASLVSARTRRSASILLPRGFNTLSISKDRRRRSNWKRGEWNPNPFQAANTFFLGSDNFCLHPEILGQVHLMPHFLHAPDHMMSSLSLTSYTSWHAVNVNIVANQLQWGCSICCKIVDCIVPLWSSSLLPNLLSAHDVRKYFAL